jgi:hypothetical protein
MMHGWDRSHSIELQSILKWRLFCLS